MASPRVLILGIGNILWADEGFGVRCVELLNQQYRFDESVTLLDGGTQGIYLVQHVQDADILVVFDAVDYGLPAGTLKLVENDEVPKFMGAKQMSLHQTGFQEVLALAEFTGHYPEHLLLIGCQPVELEDFGGSLREPVKAQVQPAIEIALDYLAKHGVKPEGDSHTADPLAPEELMMDRYEAERPSEEQAFRKGDLRYLVGARAKTTTGGEE